MNFKFIDKNQDFYINKNGELVICFDKYDVAPGYMGLVEFTIPNNVIKPLLNK
ncbi:RsiV family protein [Romboutsia hominis]|nr:RsiV family protein [Romboutsia hominis]MCH1968737.1 RsiV family protein [Romboutsia hominis]